MDAHIFLNSCAATGKAVPFPDGVSCGGRARSAFMSTHRREARDCSRSDSARLSNGREGMIRIEPPHVVPLRPG